MGLFGSSSKLRAKVQPLTPEHAEFRDQLLGSLKNLLAGGKATRKELAGALEPATTRISDMLKEGGDIWGPYMGKSLGYAESMLGRTAEDYMGGYDPAQQKEALMSAYTQNAPEQIRQLLTSAGLQAPGITHGRVREEAGRTAGNLYDELQRALAEQNLAAAQFGSRAEQLAATERGTGAQWLYGWGDEAARQQQLAQMLAAMEMIPWSAQLAMTQPGMQYDPWKWQDQWQWYTKGGTPGVGQAILGGLGSLAGQDTFFSGLISQLLGGGEAPAGGNPLLSSSWLQFLS